MPKTLQFRRGTTAELSSITGAPGELFVDTTKDIVVVSDGVTAGGFPLQSELVSNVNIKTINGTSVLGSGDIVVAGSYGNADVAAYLPTYTGNLASLTGNVTTTANISGGNIKTTGIVSATGNITGSFFIGNGSQLTGVTASADFSAIAEDVLPMFSEVYDIGSVDKRWYDVFASNKVDIGGAEITGSEAGVVVDTLLAGELLVSDNLITPSDSTARQYLGDKGVVVTNGNMDIEGDWLKIPVVATANVIIETPGWSAGGSLLQARFDAAGAGDQDAGLIFGGDAASGKTDSTEEYNGTTWSSGASLSRTNAALGGAGTQDAALAFGGNQSGGQGFNTSEEYNGISWSAGGNLNGFSHFLAGAGTQDAALAIGGLTSSGILDSVEEYNGTTWSSGGSLLYPTYYSTGTGTQDAALLIGGSVNFLTTNLVEEYDGTAWSLGGSLSVPRRQAASSGSQNAAFAIGGAQEFPLAELASTEEYNGTVWSSGPSLATPRTAAVAAAAQSDSTFVTGGLNYVSGLSILASTEEYGITTTVVSVPPLTTGEPGLIRYNQDTSSYQSYTTEWGPLSGGAAAIEEVGINSLSSTGFGAGTSGSKNNFFGFSAGACNTTGCNNNFFGALVAPNNTTGCNNNFLGSNTGRCNSTGQDNNFFGDGAGLFNTTGSYNNFFGRSAGLFNSTGSQNIFIGRWAGREVTGSNNLLFGQNAGTTSSSPSGLADVGSESNRIIMGNGSHTCAQIQIAWTTVSDARDKCIYGAIDRGLGFLKNVNPVEFAFKDRVTGELQDPVGKRRYGFSAQEILAIEGDNPVIVSTENPDQLQMTNDYLIPILVNAVKELAAQVEELKSKRD